MQPNIFSRQPPSFRSFIIAVITCLVVLFFDWRMPYVIQPARDVLYAAYNPIYALASYPVLSREWLNQQTKSEAQLRRENTAMQAELYKLKSAYRSFLNCQLKIPVYEAFLIHR